MSVIVPALQRLSSAFAVLFGRYGDVTRHAHVHGQSRQAVYRESARLVEEVEGAKSQARIAHLEQQLAAQAAQLQELLGRLERAVEIRADLLAEFASTAQAEGVSLPTARRLLAIFLGDRAPSVATLGRYSRQAAEQAGRLLEVLDAVARPRAAQAAADEIFLAAGRP